MYSVEVVMLITAIFIVCGMAVVLVKMINKKEGKEPTWNVKVGFNIADRAKPITLVENVSERKARELAMLLSGLGDFPNKTYYVERSK